MLNQWNHHLVFPPSVVPPDSSVSLLLSSQLTDVVSDATPFNFAVDVVSGFDDGIGVVLNNFQLLAPWFIYSFMGVEMVLYWLLSLLIYPHALLLKKAGLVAFIVIDDQWERVFSQSTQPVNLRVFSLLSKPMSQYANGLASPL